MKAVSTSLGSGAIKHVDLESVMHEDWVDILLLDLNI